MLQETVSHGFNIEETPRTLIGTKDHIFNQKAIDYGVLEAYFDVVSRPTETLALGMRGCDGPKQVGRECGNAALARQVVADKSNLADSGMFFHDPLVLASVQRWHRLLSLCQRIILSNFLLTKTCMASSRCLY